MLSYKGWTARDLEIGEEVCGRLLLVSEVSRTGRQVGTEGGDEEGESEDTCFVGSCSYHHLWA